MYLVTMTEKQRKYGTIETRLLNVTANRFHTEIDVKTILKNTGATNVTPDDGEDYRCLQGLIFKNRDGNWCRLEVLELKDLDGAEMILSRVEADW